MFAPVAVALVVGFLGWAYQALKPPPPKICGSLNGPPVTSPRVRLTDGRHLAYRETGVSKEEAKYKIIVIHGFDSSKDLNLPVPEELMDELKIYFLFFDRAGYGESDPNPKRSVKSEAFDIQELADKVQIGPKFYVIGISTGAYPVWSCLKYIPHRSFTSSAICQLLVAMFSCQSIKGGIKEVASTGSVDISSCTLHPLFVPLVDDPKMVSFVKYHGWKLVHFQPPRFGDVEEVVRNPKHWSGKDQAARCL